MGYWVSIAISPTEFFTKWNQGTSYGMPLVQRDGCTNKVRGNGAMFYCITESRAPPLSHYNKIHIYVIDFLHFEGKQVL